MWKKKNYGCKKKGKHSKVVLSVKIQSKKANKKWKRRKKNKRGLMDN